MFEIRTDLDNVTDLEPIVIGEQALPTRMYIRDVTVERGDQHVLTATFTERDVVVHFQDADGWTLNVTFSRDERSLLIQSHDVDQFVIEPAS
jgi:hypothetical protein